MEDVNERFKKLIAELTYGAQNKFASEIGVPPSTISSIVGGKRVKPGYDILHKIKTRYNNVNIDWLVTGEGEMLLESSKPQDNGAFGSEVERQLREKLDEKDRMISERDRTIVELLKRIDPDRLGKDEVIERLVEDVKYFNPNSVTQRPTEVVLD